MDDSSPKASRAPGNRNTCHSRHSDFGRAAHRLCRGKGLEIGALHKPFDLDACVIYADRLSTTELREAYKGDARAEHIRQVQIVCTGNRYDFFDDNALDFVISSHVLEHTPNPGLALEEWNRIVRPGGIVYFVIPDKRSTYDKTRDLTDVSRLLEKHRDRVTTTSYEEYHDALVNAEGGQNTPIERVQGAFEKQESIHVHAFTADSAKEFVEALAPVIGFEMVHFELQGMHIHVALRKQEWGNAAARGDRIAVRVAEFTAALPRAGDLEAKLGTRERNIQELKKSTSWRITKPLRAVSRGLRWLLRNMRRALMLMWWLSTGQFSRAAKASPLGCRGANRSIE